jgi:hypothetical protein
VKILFMPLSILVGLVAGKVAGRIIDRVWALFSPDDPPASKDRDIDLRELALAAALQGAIVRVVKAVSDQYTRRAVYRTTGKWPGEKKPE